MHDLRIAGGTVFIDGAFGPADVLCDDGRVVAVIEPDGQGEARETLDASGLHVLSGACDPHLHLGHGIDISRPRVPADAASESAAAALGGITSFVPYLLSAEPYLPDLDALLAITGEGARVDFGFHAVIATEDQLAELPTLIGRGIPTAKLFMNIRGDEGVRLGLPGTDDGFLLRLLEVLGAHRGMLCPHPENIELAWVLGERVRAADPKGAGGLESWNATRPPFVEAEAVQRAGFLGRITGTPVYFVHTSSAEALDAALAQRAQGAPVTIETCVHYLTDDYTCDAGAVAKVNPPLRAPSDRDALWAAIERGDIDSIGTDHIHRPMTSKQGGIWKASPGFPGLDTFLPALFTEAARRGVGAEKIVPLVTSGPCDAMGLSPRKGRIAPGADADFALVDMAARWTVTADDLATDAGYSVYEGREMTARVEHVLVRGRAVIREHRLVDGTEGHGGFVARKLSSRLYAPRDVKAAGQDV
jgi:dihydroorotase-like cyclic amidohydrolase